MGPVFTEAPSLEHMWCGMEKSGWTTEDSEEADATRDVVMKDTETASSLASSRPTTVGAGKNVKKLSSPCQGSACDCIPGKSMFPLNQFMPILVNDMKKDYCIKVFNSHTNTKLSKKQFKLGVIQLRSAEKLAMTVSDAMRHPPLDNLIFNSSRTLWRNLEGEAKRFLEKLGDANDRKLVRDILRHKAPNPGSDASLIAALTLGDVSSINLSAPKALGEARLATATESTEFMRVVFGDEITQVAAGGGFYCQEGHNPSMRQKP